MQTSHSLPFLFLFPHSNGGRGAYISQHPKSLVISSVLKQVHTVASAQLLVWVNLQSNSTIYLIWNKTCDEEYGHNFYMRSTNIYLSFVGKDIKTSFLFFIYWLLYPDMLPVKVQVFLYSRKSKFQSAWDANRMHIMHEPYFINLKHFSMKIRQHIHPCCCRVVCISVFSAVEHIQNRTSLELLSTTCLPASLKSIIL